MELFRNPNIDFLGKKWFFLGLSLVLSVGGVLSMLFWHHIPLGVDFRGGTIVDVKFTSAPDLEKIRSTLNKAGLKDPKIQAYGVASNNEVLIDLGLRETSEQALDQGKNKIINALEKSAPAGKTDLNNAAFLTIKNYLMDKDPMHLGTDADAKYTEIGRASCRERV